MIYNVPVSPSRPLKMGDLGKEPWIDRSRCQDNRISYPEALQKLADVAARMKPCLRKESMTRHQHTAPKDKTPPMIDPNAGNQETIHEISLLEASGMICALDIFAPHSTPSADTSAMDGFALASESTTHASASTPIKFRVAGVLAAGSNVQDYDAWSMNTETSSSTDPLCIEIMTGACFPDCQYAQMDAVVKVEDVEIEEAGEAQEEDLREKYISVSGPVKHRQHRRPAGSDFSKGDLVVAAGTKIEPKQVMALTSLGVRSVHVLPGKVPGDHTEKEAGQSNFKIGVLPTGSELWNLFDAKHDKIELENERQRIPDSNGPFTFCALKSLSASYQVQYLGPCKDHEESLVEAFRSAFGDPGYDIVVTSGGVSVGRFDLVRRVLETRFQAEIVFHGCCVKPGAPVMLALVKRRGGKGLHPMTVIFGAPGNPLAAAMTIRFFVEPFLKLLESRNSSSIGNLVRDTLRDASPARIEISDKIGSPRVSPGVTRFLLATREETPVPHERKAPVLKILDDQASYKIKPFLQAEFWVSVPANHNVAHNGDLFQSHRL